MDINSTVSPDDLQRALVDLPSIGKLLKVRPYRQVWRFEFAGKAYYLKFYPRREGRLKRLVRGSPALREFLNLQAMQRAQIPSPRAVAQLSGFVIEGIKGDAVILEGIEPAKPLDQYLNELAFQGERAPDYRGLRDQVIAIVRKLGEARLGHSDLHLGNFLLSRGKLFLLDAYALHRHGLRQRDVLLLGQSVSRFASKTDLLRAWDEFSGAPLPKTNPIRKRLWRKALEATTGENRYFGRVEVDLKNLKGTTTAVQSAAPGRAVGQAAQPGAALWTAVQNLRMSSNTGEWRGHFFKHNKFPRRGSPASGIDVSLQDWQREWPKLLDAMNSDRLEVLKRSRSGDVLAGEVTIGGQVVPVVIKRPKRRMWYRYLNEIGRGGRARRAWRKAWSLVVRDVPTAWPLLVIEKRKLGYVTDSAIVFERVGGTLLPRVDFDALDQRARQNLFFRLGRTLRLIEKQGLNQYDSKSSNWMIRADEKLGPVPVVIDVDGIRRIVPTLWPIDRLLRSLRELTGYTPEDSRWVCIGYRPYARLKETSGDTPEATPD